jgi:DNA-nicking Smr family endonuclease
MARRRRLSPEERRLWEQVTATATPLRAPSVSADEPRPASADPPSAASSRPMPPEPARPRANAASAPDPQAAPARGQPQMDRRRFERLRRGRLDPEARLDLHGMNLERAHAALTGFVLDAAARDLRLLLVITGKGREPEARAWPQRHGMLRHSVPHWLAAPALAGRIPQVAPAHQRHGGGGAYYIYLRRRR